MQYLRQSTSVTVVIGPVWSTADGALKSDLAYDAAGINCDIYKNGTKVDVTLANSAGDGYFRAASGEALYLLTLSTGHTDTIGRAEISLSATGYYCKPREFVVLDEAVYDVLFGTTAPSTLAAGALMGLADDAITAAKFDESTAFPLKSVDSGATAVARTGADSDTLETLSDQVDAQATAAELAKVPKSDSTVSWNATALAAIQGEATDALNAYDPPTKTELDAGFAALASDADVAAAVRDIDNTTPAADSLGAAVNSAASAGDPWASTEGAAVHAAVVTNAAGADIAADIIALKAVADTVAVDTTTDIPALIDALPTAAEIKTAIEAGGSTLATLLSRIVGTLAAGTHNPQTGDAYARIGANGAGLTALGDTRLANLDAAVSSCEASGAAAAAVVGLSTFDPATDEVDIGAVKGVAVASVDDFKADVSGLSTLDTDDLPSEPPSASTIASQVRTELAAELARIDAAITTRLAASGYTAPPSAGTISAAVWSAVSRTLTAFGFEVEATVDEEALAAAIVAAIVEEGMVDETAIAAAVRDIDNTTPAADSLGAAINAIGGTDVTDILDWILNKMVRTDNGDGTITYVLYEDDNATPKWTWVHTTATGTRAKAT